MAPIETRDLLFAGAGILWGIVTIYHGMGEWRRRKTRASFPAMVAAGAGMTLTCLGYLVYRL
jgi:hypothetical protein